MSAKFLHVFTEENPELQRQIGCMTGIFQMFDRQHVITGRRTHGHNHKRHPSGHGVSTSVAEQCSSSPHIVLERNLNRSMNENRRISMESSRTSFSSSSCSSFSSLDHNKSTQQEALLCDQTIFPDKSTKCSPKLKTPNTDGRPPRYGPRSDASDASIHTARRSLDFRDVVKGSINRDSRGLSVKTSSKQEVKNHKLQHRDSPRPIQLSRLTDGKLGLPIDLDESIRVLIKLKEAPWHFSEFGESPRTSFEAKNVSSYPESKEAHRFSFDGREITRQSLDSREDGKLPSNFRDLPRLSLDSREGSLRYSDFESKPNSNFKDLDRSNSNQRVSTDSNLDQELGTHKRSTSVVAKLMGLEAMPSLSLVTQDPLKEPRPMPSITSNDDGENWLPSPKRSIKIKGPDSRMKPISNSKVPVETAPWRQTEKRHVPKKAAFVHREAQMKQQRESAYYSDIEKKLKELEFRQSNKDLRALQQILDAMQEKGLLETKNGDEGADNQTLRSASRTPGTFESPIVIMKPANSIKRSSLQGIQKLKASEKKTNLKEIFDKKTSSKIEDTGSLKLRTKTAQVSTTRAQQSTRENAGSSLKTSGSVSPRLQQKRLEAERSRPPLPSSDANKPHRSSSNKKPIESVSPRNRLRQKPAQVQDNDEQLSESHEISQRPDSYVSLSSEVDIEVTSADRSEGGRSPRTAKKASSVKKQKKPPINLSGEVPIIEHPSPISVLDASFCQNDMSPSPSKKNLKTPKDNKNQTSDESWTSSQMSSSQINQKKLRNIENLVQKLSELSSTDKGLLTTDHIASLCETQNPDHRYVSEILIASGLLLRDLNASPLGPKPLQLHPSGHPINPDLFLVLEQTKALQSKTDQDKLHRKLVFDAVNEVLIQKLELSSSNPIKISCRFPSGQKLLKELCQEIDQLQVRAEAATNENSEDEVKISVEDILRRSRGWSEFGKEVPGIVLEVERLVFKDLVDEVVNGDAVSNLQYKASRRQRQLFAK